jgi:hypothetical protein
MISKEAAKMKFVSFALLIVLFAFTQVGFSLALSDYQKGVLDGLNWGWDMSHLYDQAKAGDVVAYNKAVAEYNAWIQSIFGMNESLMLQTIAETAKSQPYYISKSYTPVHSIDASWNQSRSLLPDADAYGMVNGIPAETYYSFGPALMNF